MRQHKGETKGVTQNGLHSSMQDTQGHISLPPSLLDSPALCYRVSHKRPGVSTVLQWPLQGPSPLRWPLISMDPTQWRTQALARLIGKAPPANRLLPGPLLRLEWTLTHPLNMEMPRSAGAVFLACKGLKLGKKSTERKIELKDTQKLPKALAYS